MEFYENINRAEDRIDNISELISSKREYIGKQALNVVLMVIVLAITGCLDFMHPSIHLENLLHLSFWSAIASKLIAGICMFNIGINLFWDSTIKRNSTLLQAIDEYKKLIAYKQIDFEYFITKMFNPQQKKKAYISQINRKIYLLNRFSKARDRLLYSSNLEENKEKKLKNRYCRRRKELETLKTDEYIDANLESIYVKYNEVDPSIFELEIDGSKRVTGVRTNGNVGLGKVKASSNVALGIFGMTAFTTAILFELNSTEFADQMVDFWNYLIKCVIDIGTMVWQLIRGTYKCRSIISKEITEPYVGRNIVLNAYINWRVETKQPDTPVYKELHKDDDVLEISVEDLEKIQKTADN